MRFKSYLLSLGIDDPVTRDSFRNESQFHKSLARQLADFLKQPIEVSGFVKFCFIHFWLLVDCSQAQRYKHKWNPKMNFFIL